MGAWGVKALENDETLDWLGYGPERLLDKEQVSRLLSSDDVSLQVLGAAVVVTSVQGVRKEYLGFVHDEFAPIFDKVAQLNYSSLIESAKYVVDYRIQNIIQDGWLPNFQAERESYLRGIAKGLSSRNTPSKSKTVSKREYRITFKGKGVITAQGISPQDAFHKLYPNLELYATTQQVCANVYIELLNGQRATKKWYMAKGKS